MNPLPLAGAHALVVDDDEAVLRFHQQALVRLGLDTVAVTTAELALEALAQRAFDLVLTDVRLPGMSGSELLAEARRIQPDATVVLTTGYGSIDAAVEAMRAGAADYLTKPLSLAELEERVLRALRLRRLEAENRWLHKELAQSHSPGLLVAVSARMREVVQTIDKVAASEATVLLLGESGTGKELAARTIHYRSARSAFPFVPVNCAAIPAGLIESELFGHARGAFTGAVRDSPGRIESASQGTLFLDEIAELPLEMQPKLLRALELKSVERVGEHKPRQIDFRLIAATNCDLAARVRQGRFREDLYYRLAVVPLELPPLRERREDIAPLARFLIHRIAGSNAPELSDEVLHELTRRSWRGNVRELANLLERTVALHEGGPVDLEELAVEPSVLMPGPRPDPDTAQPPAANESRQPHVRLPPEGAPLDQMVRDLVVQALERQGWNQSAAARMLSIPRHILQYRMQKYGIVRPGSSGE